MEDNNTIHEKNIDRLLIVDDAAAIREQLGLFFSSKGFNVRTAENGRIALNILKNEYFPVVITDFEMPVMDGYELISNIESFDLKPVIILLTSHADQDLIIKIMKMGVFDYIIKPTSTDDLYMKVSRACKVAEINKINEIAKKERVLRLEQQLEWYKWMERAKSNYSKKNEQDFFTNLHRCLCQGTNFGAQVTLLDMLLNNIQKDGDKYVISENYINILSETHKMTKKALEQFSLMARIMVEPLETETITCEELYNLMNDIISEVDEYRNIQNHTIIVSDKKSLFSQNHIAINKDLMKRIIQEILINAMKYSKANSIILSLLSINKTSAAISIINDPAKINNKKKEIGIPVEYENIIFEPFFRISKVVYEQYKTLDFGLGLTLAEQIVKKHRGNIQISNIIDNSNLETGPVTKVNCVMEYPLCA